MVGFVGFLWPKLGFLLICGRFCWFVVVGVGFFVDLWWLELGFLLICGGFCWFVVTGVGFFY